MKSLHTDPGETLTDFVDRLPGDIRELIHEYGTSIVVTFYNAGVKDPSTMRHLIRSARLGAREPGNIKRGKKSALHCLDNFLVGSGSGLTASQIVRVIRDGGYTVIHASGLTTKALNASMSAVSADGPRLTKEKKHAYRLQAAITAADREAWGDL